MKPAQSLRVFQVARENLRDLAALDPGRFGDLTNQARRAAVSVISNINESCGCSTDRLRALYIGHARASNKELLGQLLIMSDLGALADNHPLHQRVDRLGAMLHRLHQHLL